MDARQRQANKLILLLCTISWCLGTPTSPRRQLVAVRTTPGSLILQVPSTEISRLEPRPRFGAILQPRGEAPSLASTSFPASASAPASPTQTLALSNFSLPSSSPDLPPHLHVINFTFSNASSGEGSATEDRTRKRKLLKRVGRKKIKSGGAINKAKARPDSKNPDRQPPLKNVAEVSQEADRNFKFEFETAQGSVRREEGFLRDANSESPVQVIEGSYSYTGTDGKVYTVDYIADEKGFRASGAHIPIAAEVDN